MGRAVNRQQRRKSARHQAKQPVIIAGDGIVAAELTGHTFEAKPHAELPPKQPGRHRFIATAAYVLALDDARGAWDPDRLKFMDSENLLYLAIGCWDCEQVLGPPGTGVQAGSPCPAPAAD